MRTIYINGRFLCQKITGVQRLAMELTKKIDIMNDFNAIQFKLISPSKKYIKNDIELKNIQIIELKGKPNYYWEQIKLPLFCKKHKPDDLLSFCSIAPILYPGSCFIHDLNWIDEPKGFSFKFRVAYNVILFFNIKRYKYVFTVSNFTKENIEKRFNIDNVKLIGTAADHILKIIPIKPKVSLPEKFYFSLGSSNPNKNFKSIIKMAKENPDLNFVISGQNHSAFGNDKQEKLDNLIYTGYLNDSEIVYLYKNCCAFLFPSIIEGFGLPPLEALLCGCKNVICNDISVLHEIYEGYVTFVDFNKTINLKNIKNANLNDIDKLIDKYNWKENCNRLLLIYSNEFEDNL